jgi:hypothetical protein
LLNGRAGDFAGIPSGCRPFFSTTSGGIASLNRPAKSFDASGIGIVTLPESAY